MAPHKVHDNRMVGLLAGTLEGVLPAYETYEFELKKTPEFFNASEDVQPYNHNYPKGAAIFAKTTTGEALRLALHTTFSAMFGEQPFDTRHGETSTGESFIRLLHSGKRASLARLYDFALTTEGFFRIAEAELWGIRDMLSKHSVLANGAEEVFYAGTLTFMDNGKVLVITNDSGTYSPKAENFMKLTSLLRAEFDGLAVIGLTHEHPQYKKLLEDHTYTPLEVINHLLT